MGKYQKVSVENVDNLTPAEHEVSKEDMEKIEEEITSDNFQYGEVPLCREYFLSRPIIERDLTNICSGNQDRETSLWPDVEYSSFRSWGGLTCGGGNKTNGEDYVTVAAKLYGILGSNGKPKKTDLPKVYAILKLVAGGSSREEIEAAIEAVKTGNKVVNTIAKKTKAKLIDAGTPSDKGLESSDEKSESDRENQKNAKVNFVLVNKDTVSNSANERALTVMNNVIDIENPNSNEMIPSVNWTYGRPQLKRQLLIGNMDESKNTKANTPRNTKANTPKKTPVSNPKNIGDHLKDLAWKHPSETHGGNLFRYMTERRRLLYDTFQSIQNGNGEDEPKVAPPKELQPIEKPQEKEKEQDVKKPAKDEKNSAQAA